MNEISVWHSRPLDVHRWSDHPEVAGLVEKIAKKHLPEQKQKSRGPKPKTTSLHQLRVLILDLYVAWLEDPDLCIGISLSSNAWHAGSRYNALHISKKIIPIVHSLVDAGLLDMENHSYKGPNSKYNRTTRIRASEKLQKLFRKAKFDRDDIGRTEGEEVIILKNDKNKQIEYEDTPDTTKWRKELTSYNNLISNSFIDIPDLENPVIEVDGVDEVNKVWIGSHNTKTHRVFSRSTWDKHGRFYGGWWQRVNSETRARITIDDQPTVEVDFVGLHIAILYAETGEELDFDPYDGSHDEFKSFPPVLKRNLIKRLALIAINAKEKSSAYQAFRNGFPKKHVGSRISNETLDRLLAAFLAKNPCLKGKLFTDQGIRLMHLDGQITSHIQNALTTLNIPVLSVHDSYIVNCWKVKELREAMAEASKAVVGKTLRSAIKLPGRAEYSWVSDAELQVYIENNLSPPRCTGYVERLQAFEKQTGRAIGPYDDDPNLMDTDALGDPA